MRILLIFWAAVCACAQSGIQVPSIGAVVDASGALRPVQGVAGSFLLGPATVPGVLSAACSQRMCLAKTDSKILSATGETNAPPGPAVFDLDGSAIVYFPKARTFARWHDDSLDPLDWATDYWKDAGEVLSILVRGGETEIAVRRDENVWIVHPDGSVVDGIHHVSGPVLLLKEGLIYATPDELVLRHSDASEVRFELMGADSISALGPRYAAIYAGDAAYALRTEPGSEKLFQLPGNPP
jgi:hypothetical protein